MTSRSLLPAGPEAGRSGPPGSRQITSQSETREAEISLQLLFTEYLQIDRVPIVPADPADLLRQRGYRVTGQRLAVLRAVSGQPHVTADYVAETVRAEMGTISIQAVYDVLGVLVDVGLVRRIQPAGSPARFEARVSDNHHHVICRACGRTADVDCAVGSAPCLTAVDDMGYEIDEAEVIYWGHCPECRSQTGT
jgi:Fur family transcriptional regulator, stress-responsive regulator